jgi:transcriptional regulator with XRE-family HTH domain
MLSLRFGEVVMSEDVADAAKEAFAARLRSIMSKRGLTAAETARRMRDHLPDGGRASRATVSHYRAARALPRLRYLDALSLALGVDRSELLPTLNADDSAGASDARREIGPREAPASSEATAPELHSARLCSIEDHGDEVHLQVNQRVSWEVALTILSALKAKPAGESSGGGASSN